MENIDNVYNKIILLFVSEYTILINHFDRHIIKSFFFNNTLLKGRHSGSNT